MQGQVISGRSVCPHCRVQQIPQAKLQQASGSRVQKRAWVQLCTHAAKQEAASSPEDLSKDSRAEARRKRRENRQAVEPEVDIDSPVDIDPVSQLVLVFSLIHYCFAQASSKVMCMVFRQTLKC